MSYILDMLKAGKVDVSEFKPVTVYDFFDYRPVSLDEYEQAAEYLKLLLEAQKEEVYKICAKTCGRRML